MDDGDGGIWWLYIWGCPYGCLNTAIDNPPTIKPIFNERVGMRKQYDSAELRDTDRAGMHGSEQHRHSGSFGMLGLLDNAQREGSC
jgi:hypothetical protein